MNIDSLLKTSGDYLKAADLESPIMMTISGAEPIRLEEKEPEKLLLHFKDDERILVTNRTNMQLLVSFFASTETNDWIGKQIVLYNDKTIMMGGRMVGGVRVRLPKGVEPAGEKEFDDDVPF
jgi:hypothetical protein